MDSSPKISIVMPCLNEAGTLKDCIEEGLRAFADNNLHGEIIVADNGSEDGSPEIARSCGAHVVHVPRKGYGNALRAGICAARGKYILMGDADCSYDFGSVKAFVTELDKGCDLVMGNRFSPDGGIERGAMPWKNRYIGNPVLSFIGRAFFACPCRDFHCGLRAFTKAAFEKMELRTEGMEFASEIVIRATLLKLKIGEIPIKLRPDRRKRRPHLRPWRDGWRHLRFMLLYSPRWLFLYPGFFLMLAGFFVGAYLMFSPIRVGGVTLDVHTLFFCAVALLMGVQSVFFAVLTKVFAIKNELAPANKTLEKLMRFVSLETGLAVGGAVFFFGFFLSFLAVAYWGAADFGKIDPREMLRMVIPGGCLLALGCQLCFNSFFLSILDLKFSK